MVTTNVGAPMLLPSPAQPAASTVGFFACPLDKLGAWLVKALGSQWRLKQLSASSLNQVLALVQPASILNRYVLMENGAWTLLLDNGPLGTDLGVLPFHACRDLRCLVVRASYSLGKYPATVFEVYDHAAPEETLHVRRSIAAANDGGKWVFQQFGAPYAFENVDAYGSRRKRDRLTPEMLSTYLDAIGVPHCALPNLDRLLVADCSLPQIIR